jgi:GDSL-like Lipase/Acylhydrolase family
MATARRQVVGVAMLVVGLGLAVGTLVPAARTATEQRTVHVDGDSLAYGTDLYLPRYLPGWTITQAVDVSRHSSDGAAAIAALGPSLPRVVVVSLGTNDDPGAVEQFASSVRRVVRAAGPSRCVIWSTIVRPPYRGVSYAGYNRVLHSAARRWQNFHVFDWVALAEHHRSWFGADGVHPSMAGYRARAVRLARLVKSC